MTQKIEITLKQETPMIHFQHGQHGATLRATEVKPKLDKWLRSRYPHKIPEEWYTKAAGDRPRAFDYKLRFTADENTKKVDPVGPHTPYEICWTETRSNVEHPAQCVSYDTVRMTVVCFHPDLLTFIQGELKDFFIATNFGKMQGKGFGSFSLSGIDYTPQEISQVLRDTYGAQKCYCFTAADPDKVFGQIKTLYSIMKSGLNLGFKYRRSLLFMYMHTPPYRLGNEKEYLKRLHIAPTYGTHPHAMGSETDDSRYVRALMGIGSVMMFRAPGQPTQTVFISGRIKRYPSTVFFKVIGGNVYYVGKRIDTKLLDQCFNFKNKYTNDSRTRNTPSPSQVSADFMDGFLAYCYANFENPPAGQQPLSQFTDMNNINLREVNNGNVR